MRHPPSATLPSSRAPRCSRGARRREPHPLARIYGAEGHAVWALVRATAMLAAARGARRGACCTWMCWGSAISRGCTRGKGTASTGAPGVLDAPRLELAHRDDGRLLISIYIVLVEGNKGLGRRVYICARELVHGVLARGVRRMQDLFFTTFVTKIFVTAVRRPASSAPAPRASWPPSSCSTKVAGHELPTFAPLQRTCWCNWRNRTITRSDETCTHRRITAATAAASRWLFAASTTTTSTTTAR